MDIARHTVEADRARIQLWNENETAALAQMKTLAEGEQAWREAARAVQNMEAYLRISAPFDGVITERNVHKGSLAGLSAGSAQPLLRVQQVSRLRLVVPVPEIEVAGLAPGAKVNFTVPAFSGVKPSTVRSPASDTRLTPRRAPCRLNWMWRIRRDGSRRACFPK